MIVKLAILIALSPITSVLAQEACLEPIEVYSPCAGVLLPTEVASRAQKCLEIDLPVQATEIEFLRASLSSKEAYYNSIIDAREKANSSLRERLERVIEAVGPRPWYQNPGFWAGVGFAAGAGVVVSLTYAVND